MKLLLIQLRCQTSDALLELAVLGGIDERVDKAVGEHQHHGEMIVPAVNVDVTSVEADQTHDVVRREADDEPRADH